MLAPIFPSPTIPSFVITEVSLEGWWIANVAPANHELPTKSRSEASLSRLASGETVAEANSLSRFAAHVK